MELRLAKLDRLDTIESSTSKVRNDSIIVSQYEEKLKEQFVNLDSKVLKSTSKMVSKLLFQSKESPWWMSINALSNYIDWLYCHSIDVALISLLIANKLNYDKQAQSNICLGALLHDIGKLLVPKEILQKPGALTEQEWLLVKQHCELGYGMIKEFDLPECCTDIILQHQERLDGSGYPYCLTENEISQYAKIVMVADVVDAITSYRPYKEIGTMKFALEELKNNGKKFDQEIVNVLFDM